MPEASCLALRGVCKLAGPVNLLPMKNNWWSCGRNSLAVKQQGHQITGGPLGPLIYPGTTGKAGCDPAKLATL